MCGIVGFFGSNLPESDRMKNILSTIVHRGRDDSGSIHQKNFVLGHNRLSIMDVKGGHQPLHDSGSQLYTIANGEIYNYPQWCDRLKETYHFSTHSDTEILLPLYQRFASETAYQLDGMFSFIIANEEEFLIARDRLGIKPLYYVEDGENLIFASEIKALINHYEDIKEFPQGHYYHSTQGLQSYYSLPEPDSFLQDLDLILEKIRQGLSASVQKRLMSDVPVGVFLSGGLDSNIIAYLMKQNVEQLHSFSVGFANSPDLKSARLVAEHLGIIHHEYVYTEAEMLEILPDVIYHLESYNASLIRSSIPCYIVSRLASQYVKVILTGEGADELFAGYSYLAYGVLKYLASRGIEPLLRRRSNINLLEQEFKDYDIFINTVEIAEGDAPIVTFKMLDSLKSTGWIIDAAADTGRAIQGTRATKIDNPIYQDEQGHTFYVVDNSPSILYRESSEAVSEGYAKYFWHKPMSYWYSDYCIVDNKIKI